MKKNIEQTEQTDIQIDRIAYLGTVVTVLGTTISAVAEGLALRAVETAVTDYDPAADMQKLQQQIEQLTYEVRQLRRMLR